jgi:hypothetical protein
MSDIFDTNPFKSFFFAGNDKNVPQDLRQKIALAMLMKQKRAYPKTFGEGLSAIGESIGDIGERRRLESEAADAEKVAQAGRTDITGKPTSTPTPYAPPDEVPPAVAAIDRAAPPAPPVPPPSPLATPPAVQLPPDQQQSYAPGAPVRMTPPAAINAWRGQNPLPRGMPPPPQAAPPPQAPPLPPDAPASFSDRFPGQQSAAPPPPGAPVMAEDTPLPMPDPRGAAARALMMQAGPPPNPMTPAPPGGADRQDAGIRLAPPATPPIGKAPTQAQLNEPAQADVGYVMPARQPPPQPRTTTDVMDQIQKKIWDTPPAYRKSMQEALAPLYQQEQAKVAQAHELWKDQMTQHRALELKREDQLSARAKSVLDAREQQQKLIDYGQTRAPGAGPDPRLGTDQSPQRTGIPEPEPMPRGVIPQKWSEDQQKKMSAAADALDAAKPEVAQTLDLIGKARTHPSKEWSVGSFGGLAKLTASGQGFAAIMEQLTGKNMLVAYQKAKGAGPISEKEGEALSKAQARLSTAQSPKDFDTALNDLDSMLRGAFERSERKMNRPVTAYQKSPEDPYAPDIGERRTDKSGQVWEYIGGDPESPTSRRRVK